MYCRSLVFVFFRFVVFVVVVDYCVEAFFSLWSLVKGVFAPALFGFVLADYFVKPIVVVFYAYYAQVFHLMNECGDRYAVGCVQVYGFFQGDEVSL